MAFDYGLVKAIVDKGATHIALVVPSRTRSAIPRIASADNQVFAGKAVEPFAYRVISEFGRQLDAVVLV